jgi:hypothetical protein
LLFHRLGQQAVAVGPTTQGAADGKTEDTGPIAALE